MGGHTGQKTIQTCKFKSKDKVGGLINLTVMFFGGGFGKKLEYLESIHPCTRRTCIPDAETAALNVTLGEKNQPALIS